MSEEKDEMPEKVEWDCPYEPVIHKKMYAQQREDYFPGVNIALWMQCGDTYYGVKNLELDKIGTKENPPRIPSSVQLTVEQAQELMNSLWDAGVRPEKTKLKELQVGAMEHHLDDMRSLVFDHLLPAVKAPRMVDIDPGDKSILMDAVKDKED